jgi:hypothetical protein
VEEEEEEEEEEAPHNVKLPTTMDAVCLAAWKELPIGALPPTKDDSAAPNVGRYSYIMLVFAAVGACRAWSL